MLTKELILSKYPKYSNILDIKKLDIFGEDLENISIISQMTNLEYISLSSNKISSLSALTNCFNLKELFLRNNSICSFKELYHLQNLSHLKELWLDGNPISSDVFYRKKVLNILPQIHFLDNKKVLLYKCKNEKKRGQSEEQKQLKNNFDYNANISSRKKILLRRVYSYFEPSNEGIYIETSNNESVENNKNKNETNCNNKKGYFSEFKIKFCNKGKSAKKDKKNFKKIKLKLKSDKQINFSNNIQLYNYLGNGPKILNRKLTVDTNPNLNPKKVIKRENITVQNSIIHQNSSDLKEDFKIKKITFFGNKDLYRNMNKYNKNDDKISININNYENDNNSNLMKAYSLIEKMNIQDLLSLREVINRKISIITK